MSESTIFERKYQLLRYILFTNCLSASLWVSQKLAYWKRTNLLLFVTMSTFPKSWTVLSIPTTLFGRAQLCSLRPCFYSFKQRKVKHQSSLRRKKCNAIQIFFLSWEGSFIYVFLLPFISLILCFSQKRRQSPCLAPAVNTCIWSINHAKCPSIQCSLFIWLRYGEWFHQFENYFFSRVPRSDFDGWQGESQLYVKHKILKEQKPVSKIVLHLNTQFIEKTEVALLIFR